MVSECSPNLNFRQIGVAAKFHRGYKNSAGCIDQHRNFLRRGRSLDESAGFDTMTSQQRSDVRQDAQASSTGSTGGPHLEAPPSDHIPATKSIHTAAMEEANRHKWIESQKHGRDMGETALREWYRLHWYDYCRSCHLQHLDGKQPWREFDQQIFGHLLELMKSKDVLLERILDRVCEGQENLSLIHI